MGTNFYWRDIDLVCPNPCQHCGQQTVFHVGKSSGGWSFGFRGYTEEESPFGFPVMSRADWRKVFARRGELTSEYRVEVDDPVAWLDELEPPTLPQIRNESSWSQYVWPRDAEGFRITNTEFS